ncbi:hypothetical protein AR679_gp158 [Yellowstone lake phycodnavirus 1]|jgi:hypothetical protein|uniref:hypothetical protein n=1 Tax=Yellowstone lake phycodnavirus 1 TaxID=1586713 RepID=UPI0006EB980C|nr:hypothetical protein AR679_gp158 [Yellowstone lake phycodnavirus 1]BAT22184.1 hypothetical protein [Yellowstone lake phycodnavirus 1]
MAGVIGAVATQLEAQSLNSVVAGFSFAAAVAWMDVVRAIVAQVVQVQKNGTQYLLLSALFTTLLSILVYMLIKTFVTNVKIQEPSQPLYAVTRA